MYLLIIIIVLLVLIFLGWIGMGYTGLNVAMKRRNELDMSDRDKLEGSPWGTYYDAIIAGIDWINSHEKEVIEIESFDGLKLQGRLIKNPEAIGTVLMFHGYKTHPEVDFSASSHIYYGCKNNIVHIDQRAAGNSEGEYITFGVKEGKDCQTWIKYFTERFGEDHPIIIAGLSMGATTVLRAAEGDLPANVKSIVADSPFVCPAEVIKERIRTKYHIKGNVFTAAIDIWSRIKVGYSIYDWELMDIVKGIDVPVLFVHCLEDRTVPYKMAERMHNDCKAPHDVMLVPDADHGVAYMVDQERYIGLLKKYCGYDEI